MKILLVLFLCLLYPFVLFSQPLNSHKPSAKITFQHINKDDGLSNNRVTCILQDSKGYMWIGTKNGLNKFDGYDFTIYKNDLYDSNCLRQNNISVLFEDSFGRLWIATRETNRKSWLKSSLHIYDREKDQFISFIHDPKDTLSLKNNYITSIFEDYSKKIWITTKNGLINYNAAENNFISADVANINKNKLEMRHNVIYKLKNEENNNFIIGSDKGIFLYDDNLSKVIRLPEKSKLHSLNKMNIVSICEDNFQNIWLATMSGGLYSYNLKNNTLKNYNKQINVKNLFVYSVFQAANGVIWIGTNHGLLKYYQSKNEFIHYVYDQSDPHSLSTNKIQSIYEDQSGLLWIGTDREGINLIDKQKDQFSHYLMDPNNNNSLSNNRILSIEQDKDGSIWIGTSNGLNKFDIPEQSFTRFIYSVNSRNISSKNKITKIYSGNNGNLWIGTKGAGLIKLNKDNKKIHFYRNNKSNKNNIRKIYHDNLNNLLLGTVKGLSVFSLEKEQYVNLETINNEYNILKKYMINDILEIQINNTIEIWFGTHGQGLFKYSTINNELMNYTYEINNLSSLSNNFVWSVYQDTKGMIWCSTFGGLNRLDRANNNFIRYKFDPDTLANDVSKVIYEDKTGTLWIGNNSGLFKYNREPDKFMHYDEKYGIPNSRIDGIIEDNNGFLWLSLDKKIIKFNIESESSIIYKIRQSLKNYTQISNPNKKCKSGEIIFGGHNGFLYFDPNKIKDNETIPNVSLTDFKIFNKSVKIKNENNLNDEFALLNKDISEVEEIEFSYDKNVFSIEFAALDYREPSKNKYAYRLDGIDPDWVHTDASRRFATYNQLNPGEYVFHVKGSNNDGIWNEEGKSLKIIITPLWWQTVLFKIFVIIIIIGIIGWIFYYRINALEKKHQVQEEFSRKLIDSQEMERKRIASALHDSHGQNLLVISNEMQYFTKEHDEYENELQPVTNIIQESIDEIREISYALHPHQLDKLGLVKTIKSMFKKVSGSTDIKFDLTIDNIDEVFEKKIEINIYRIIQEATSNIIKHSEASEVRIDIKKKLESVEILINDNGKGFDKDEKLRSFPPDLDFPEFTKESI